MKLGANTVLFGGYDLRTAFERLMLSGYDGVELSAISGMSEHLVLSCWEEQVSDIRQLARDYSLSLLAIEQPSQDAKVMEQAFQAANALEIPVVNCGPGGKSNDPQSFQQMIDSLGSLALMAEKYGVTLCVKAHVGAAIHNTPTTLKALDAINSLAFGLDMDPSHIYRAGEDPVESLRSVINRVKHVHIRDCKGRQQGPGKPEDQTNGRGDIDLLGYIRVLHEHSYSGPLDLEIIGAKDYPLERCTIIAAEARGHMQACLQACHAR